MSHTRSRRRICRGPTTDLPTRAIRRACCSAGLIASTGSVASPIRRRTTAANMDSSSTDPRYKETTMHIVRTMIAESRGVAGLAIRAAIVAGCSLVICGCNTDRPQVAAVPDVPADYRLRHPITISEADHSLEIFVGSNRGELSATQRAEVMAFAQTWKREATGGVLVNLPLGTGNARAAA